MRKKILEFSNRNNTIDFMISILKTSIKDKTKNMHQHKHYEIVRFEPADHYLYMDNNKYHIVENAFILFPPHVKHKVMRKKVTITRLLINFNDDFAKPIADFLNLDLKQLFADPVLIYSDQQIETLRELSDKMLIEFNKNMVAGNNQYLKLLFANFLYTLSQPTQKIRPEHFEELKINNVIDYLNRNYYDEITLEFLSNKFFISKFELCRKIKSITGYTFANYLAQLRINHSREYLENSRLTINEISSQVGYHSPAYFSSSFKKALGMSPIEYRQKFQNEIG